MKPSKYPPVSCLWILGIQAVLGYQWLLSGLEKVTAPNFMRGYTDTMTLFARQTVYPWYGDFIRHVVVPHAAVFGDMVRLGETAVGLAFLATVLQVLIWRRLFRWTAAVLFMASVGAMTMNANYYLATSWQGPSAQGINRIMFLTELVLTVFYLRVFLETPSFVNTTKGAASLPDAQDGSKAPFTIIRR